MEHSLPIIDIQVLLNPTGDTATVAAQLHKACTEVGFFYIINHDISEQVQAQLELLSAAFFQLGHDRKMQINMAHGGKAWRGFFPVGDELTSGKPDLKEGLYFGTELPESDVRVQEQLPLHGANLFPADMPDFRKTILTYIDAMTQLGHQLMRGIALSLGLPDDYFRIHYMQDPLCLFRIFHYPPYRNISETDYPWGVGEHTDYGMLTILKQDDKGGLQVKSKTGWIDAPYIENSFVCNIGDMLDRMTGGYYRSTPHRVRNRSGADRYSFPFFFDPDWNASIRPISLKGVQLPEDDQQQRWDKASVHQFEGSYGDYILQKVSKVFPDLQKKV
ncbi:MAG: 2-oxoglutarate and iron-dependent oxygenase domain-containing protein [Bacteroidota bacterium]